ncbi:MAG: hypothetical protein JWP12_896 [Bacteroidetes bacterium]|nr:hypothetical protein [Bacteroidota bacterium]
MKKFLLLFFVAVVNFATAQCLSGSYTIGGTSPNYTTITSAVSALTTNGVCGPVVFNIRSGTYAEQVTIPAITGSSAVNSITFESEALDTTSVNIQAAGTASVNYIIRLNGADYVTFYKLRLKNTSLTYGGVVVLQNSSDNNTFNNCSVTSIQSSAVSTAKYVFASNSTDNENCTIMNNTITGGTRGIEFTGIGATANQFIIKNNSFFLQYEYGIDLTNIRSPRITNNMFSYDYMPNSGIVLNTCNDSVIISNNKITQREASGNSITINSCTGNGLISNNMINAIWSTSGILLTNTTNMLVCHNTVVNTGSTFSNYCFSAQGTTAGNIVKNNIFYQKGNGLVYYIVSGATITADYNELYCAATGDFGVYHLTDCTNLNAWKSASGIDLNSISYFPQFVSATDFHIAADFSDNLMPPYFSRVATDIDGTVRDVAAPYVGAYEFFNTPIPNDAAINRIITPIANSCPGAQPVKILFKNQGASTLTNATINWTVNGVAQPAFNWSGSLNYNDTSTVTVGMLNFARSQSYVVKLWTSNPNGAADGFAANDTVITQQMFTRMSGAFLVGGTGSDYPSVGNARADLLTRGVCGNVTLNLSTGSFFEYFSMSVIPNQTNADTLTIQSLSGVNTATTLFYYAGSSVSLSGTHNIIFKNITIGSASGTVNTIHMDQNCQNVEFKNCIIASGTTQNASEATALDASMRDIRFINNTFTSGTTDISFTVGGIYKFSNIKIEGNTFSNTAGGAVTLSTIDTLSYQNNRVTAANPQATTTSFTGISNSVIKANKFVSTNVTPLTLTTVTSSIVANNMIILKGTLAGTGMSTATCQNLKFINNSILSTNTNTNTAAFKVVSSASGSNNKFWNNCVVNNGAGLVMSIASPSFLSLRKNAYYSNATNFGSYGSAVISSFSAWQTAVAADTAAINVNPAYTSFSDLHAHDVALKSAGVNVASYITTDYDGDARAVTPDIGADEFTVPVLDAGLASFNFGQLICSGVTPVQVYLRNSGVTTLTSAVINYKVNAVTQPVYNWSGSLASGSQTLVTLGSYNFLPAVGYTVKAWSSNPNGTPDVVTLNDTITKTYASSALNGTYTVGGTSPDFATLTAAATALRSGGVCGAVVFNIRDGIYAEQLKLQNIKGSSSVNTIKFQSQSLDSTLVTIQYNAPSTTFNYTINVDTTDYVTFYKLGLKSLNSSYSGVLLFSNKATHCEIRNCTLTGPSPGSGTLAAFQANSDSSFVAYSKFYFASDGVNMQGIYSRVLNNYFEGQTVSGITGAGASLNYSLNKFNYNASFNGTAIALNGVATSGTVSKNQVVISGNGKGVSATGGSITGILNVTNNFVSVNGSGYGIYVNLFNYGNIIHNSVYQTGSGTGVYIAGTTNVFSRNNIYYNAGSTGYCVLMAGTNSAYTSNYNCIYSPANRLVMVGATAYSTLTAYNTASGNEASSVSADPAFTSVSDLHVNGPAINNAGTYSALVPDDIDGQPRSPTTPDIGADEFTPVIINNDAQMIQLYTANSACGGTKVMYAKIKNGGINVLNSVQLTAVYLGNTYPTVNWTGALAHGAVQDSIVVANITDVYGTYSVKGWTSSPNGLPDDNVTNDTLTSTTLNSSMAGVYTIGGTAADFTTPRQAVTALKIYGVCSNVTFNIRPGTYTDTLTIPLIAGTTSYSIKFKAENNDSSSVTLQDYATSVTPPGSATYIMQLMATKNITFEKVTFQRNYFGAAPAYGINGIFITNLTAATINDLHFFNCRFICSTTSGNAICLSNANHVTNLQLKNNVFISGDYGFNLLGSSTATNVLISNNDFVNNRTSAVYIYDASYGNGAISDNRFTSTLTNQNSTSMYLRFASYTIDRNVFHLKTGSAFYMDNGSGHMQARNNYIQVDSVNIAVANSAVVYLPGAITGTQFVYNTVKARLYNAANYVININVLDPFDVKNNIFLNTGTAGKLISSASNAQEDYNRFYSATPGNFGRHSSGPVATLAAWQAVNTADAHSQYEPTYLGATPGYIPVGDYDLNNAGIPVTGVSTDIANHIRNASTPDIGAYELQSFAAADAGVKRFVMSDTAFCAGNNPVSVVLRNTGTTVLTAVDVHWKINNVVQSVYNYSGSVSSGDSATVTLGNYNFSGGRKYAFEFYTAMPNGVVDSSNVNDTLRIAPVKTRFNGVYTIGGTSPDFATLKDASDSLHVCGLCGPATFNIRSGVYATNFTITAIPFSSVINTVNFQSELLDSSTVSIANSGTALGLTAVKNIRFHAVSFVQNSALNVPSITITGAAKNIEISNCSFSKPTGVVTGSINATFVDSTAGDLTVKNNIFGINTNIVATTSGATNAKNILIRNNSFAGVTPVQASKLDNLEYSYNTAVSTVSILTSNRALAIYNNKITGGNLILSTASGTYPKNIYNNIINGGRLALTTASAAVNIYNNTILSNPAAGFGSGGCLSLSGTISNIRVRNNILESSNGKDVYEFNDPLFTSGTTAVVFDYNTAYTHSDTIAYSTASPNNVSKTQWAVNYSQDQHSVFFQPQFSGPADFHPLNDVHINNTGIANSIVTTDYDGVARSLTAPDPGVYEFNVPVVANDAGITNYTTMYCDATTSPVSVTLKNYGTSNLTTVQIGWSVNGVAQPVYNWSGALAIDSVIAITIGNYTAGGVNNFVFYTTAPNGTADGSTGNDTLSANGSAAALNGIYTIDASAGDFNSFFAAANALTQRGMCAPVEFVIAPGTYVIPSGYTAVTLNAIFGNSATNTITFRSQTGLASSVILNVEYSASATGLNLSNITGVSFKNISFMGTVDLGINSKTIAFIGDRFTTGAASPSSAYALISSSHYNEDVQLINNYFTGSGKFIAMGSNGSKQVFIKGNTFDNAYNAVAIGNVDGVVIDSNYFYRTAGAVASSYAVQISAPKNHSEILRNVVSGNFETGIGMGARAAGSNMHTPLIANNVVIAGAGTSYGINISCDSVIADYNTVQMANANIALMLAAGRDKIYNNILVSATGRLVYRTSASVNLQSDYNIFYSLGTMKFSNNFVNYNDVPSYATATGLETHSSFRNPLFASVTDLHCLNDTLAGKGIAVPEVITDRLNYLRGALTTRPGAYERGPDTLYDAVNEYLVLSRINDTLTIGSNAVTASILYGTPPGLNPDYNQYTGTVDSLRMHYQVNGGPVVTETWHGAFAYGDSLQYTFTALFNVPNGKLYDIKVWFENLNPLQTEINVSDDSLHKIIIMPMAGDYTIGGVNPDFTNFLDSRTSLNVCGTIANVRFLYRTGTYTETVAVNRNVSSYTTNWVEYTSESGNADDVHIRLSNMNQAGLMKFSNLTITPINPGGYSDGGVQIYSDLATVFDSCKFIAGSAINEKAGLMFFSQYDGAAATITNCLFKNLDYAINLSDFQCYTSSLMPDGIIFSNNVVDSCTRGVLIKDYNMGSMNKKVLVKNNKITTTGNALEIKTNGSQDLTLEANYINAGNYAFNFIVPTYRTTLINNMVNSGNSINSQITEAHNLKAYNNTFNQATYFNDPRDTITLYNNIFNTDDVAGAALLYYIVSPSLIRHVNNNNYFAPNSHVLASTSTAAYNTVAQIQSGLHTDSSSVNFNPLFLSATDLHSQSSNLKGLAKPFPFVTTDIDGESRLIDAPDIGADEINLIVTDVWPGDADKNNLVDNNDLLPIGLFYGQTGSPRASISNTWTAYPAMDWGVGQISGFDIKHIDCNGDGTIDDNDTLAVNLNFSSTHALRPMAGTHYRNLTPPMYWVTGSTDYNAGDWVTADLYLGNSSAPVTALYGIAFDVNYTASLVVPGTENFLYPNSWLGVPGTDAIKFSKADEPANTAYGAMTRIDHANAGGYGKIATYRFQLKNTTAVTTQFALDVVSYIAITANGDTVLFNTIADTITVHPFATAVNEIQSNVGITIYPNPYASSTTISYLLDKPAAVTVEVFNAIGKKIQSIVNENQQAGSYDYQFSARAKGYDAGVYFVKIIIDGKATMKKIIELK